ncbi:hypothetical protein [Streptodolium elevatio]|uniref:DUF4365 domain-containing protein n=1 Tax=Streptodolium elevatio TaxID=3157996 RepID=A0ABV3DVB7_9ACTN
MGTESAYLSKSEASARMGTAAEYLVAAVCILATAGELNVSTSLVDDEGVDLVFHRRGSTATLAVQVKARMSTGKHFQDGRILTDVSVKTFRPRPGLDILVVAVDVERGAIDTAWLVPSPVFAEMVAIPTPRGSCGFQRL